MAAEWIWYECDDESKILLAVCKESMITTIHLTLEIPTA